MNAIFVIGDVDQNGEIDLQEFKRMMIPTSFDVVSKFRAVHKTTKDVQNAFKKFDIDGDGSIDRSEMTKALTSGGQSFTQQEIDALFNAADVNRDGTVDYEEFITLMCPSAATIVHKFRSQYKSIDDVRAAFKRFDANGDGALSKNELSAALKSSGHSYSDVEVDAIFSLGDVDGDGEVSLQEFVDLMSPSSSEVLAKLRGNFRSIADVKAAFKKIDTDGDGLLSKNEMQNSPGCKFDREEVDAIFQLGDINGDGELDMGEFIALMYPPATEVTSLLNGCLKNNKNYFKVISKLSSSFRNIEDVKAAFKLLDVDGDGSITRQEMTSSGHKFSGEQVDALFALGDVNDDGALGRLFQNFDYDVSFVVSCQLLVFQILMSSLESCAHLPNLSFQESVKSTTTLMKSRKPLSALTLIRMAVSADKSWLRAASSITRRLMLCSFLET